MNYEQGMLIRRGGLILEEDLKPELAKSSSGYEPMLFK